MKIVFDKEWNTPFQYRAQGAFCSLPAKEARKLIKAGLAHEATKEEKRAAKAEEATSEDDNSDK